MGRVVELAEWRRAREPSQRRLERAVHRLEGALGARGRSAAPDWLRTAVLAIQGCLALGLIDEAAERTEHLAERAEQRLGAG